ncbi:MAG: hypothetical protein OXF09_08730 [Hyphomicrobiales bacterium]|nr:hypothetical protein [Hyphomicrobiales bacterium]
MGRPCKPPVEKTCPKCGAKFETKSRNQYCSSKCAKTREKTAEQRREHSIKIRKWKQSDAGEDNSYQIRKNKWQPPPIVHPDDPHLEKNQFVAGEELWTVAEECNHDGYGYY